MIKQHYDSYSEYVNAPEATRASLKKGTFNRKIFDLCESVAVNHADTRGTETQWYGDTSENVKLAYRTGIWETGIERVQQYLPLLPQISLPMVRDRKRRMVRADQGDELDIHAVYRGELDRAWTTPRRESMRAPATVRIVVKGAHSYAMEAEQIAWNAVAAIRLCQIIEAAGNRVEIIVQDYGKTISDSATIKEEDKLCSISYTAKTIDRPLDIAALSVSLCLPANSRDAGFRHILCRYPACQQGLCSPLNPDASLLPPPAASTITIVLRGMYSQEAATRSIEDVAKTVEEIK